MWRSLPEPSPTATPRIFPTLFASLRALNLPARTAPLVRMGGLGADLAPADQPVPPPRNTASAKNGGDGDSAEETEQDALEQFLAQEGARKRPRAAEEEASSDKTVEDDAAAEE
mgnify:CR=1 FL=1